MKKRVKKPCLLPLDWDAFGEKKEADEKEGKALAVASTTSNLMAGLLCISQHV